MSYLNDLKQIFDFDLEYFENCKDSEHIVSRFEELVQEGKKAGFTPVIVSGLEILLEKIDLDLDDEGLELNQENMKKYIKEIIEKSKENNAKDFFKERKFEMEDFEYDFPDGLVYDETKEEYGDGTDYINSFIDYSTEKPKGDIAILKLPTDKPYEAFAYIPMGGFNDCPMPEDMVVVAKYWYEKFGAVPVSITYDEVEFIVDKPPIDKKEVDKLAIEQTVFCIDIVEQGVGSVEDLAKGLKNSPYWYFWWD